MKKIIIPMFVLVVLSSCGSTETNSSDVAPVDTTEVVATDSLEVPVDTTETPVSE